MLEYCTVHTLVGNCQQISVDTLVGNAQQIQYLRSKQTNPLTAVTQKIVLSIFLKAQKFVFMTKDHLTVLIDQKPTHPLSRPGRGCQRKNYKQ